MLYEIGRYAPLAAAAALVVLAWLALPTGIECRDGRVEDTGRSTLTVRCDSPGAAELAFHVTADTTIVLNGSAATLAELSPGDRVSVAGWQRRDRVSVATTIHAASASLDDRPLQPDCPEP